MSLAHQQGQQPSSGSGGYTNMHRKFKPRRGGGNEGAPRGGASSGPVGGEFISINLHRSSDGATMVHSGGAVTSNNMGHHDVRRYSFDAAYASGGEEYDNDGTMDTKGDIGHPMMLQGQTSRQNQDNIKYARNIVRSTSSSSLKSVARHGGTDGVAGGNTGGGSSGGGGKDSRSPLHRQTLVSSSKFHKWPSVGRQRQRQQRVKTVTSKTGATQATNASGIRGQTRRRRAHVR